MGRCQGESQSVSRWEGRSMLMVCRRVGDEVARPASGHRGRRSEVTMLLHSTGWLAEGEEVRSGLVLALVLVGLVTLGCWLKSSRCGWAWTEHGWGGGGMRPMRRGRCGYGPALSPFPSLPSSCLVLPSGSLHAGSLTPSPFLVSLPLPLVSSLFHLCSRMVRGDCDWLGSCLGAEWLDRDAESAYQGLAAGFNRRGERC
ncbi:hypothetical protein BKA65DRAFT_3791 [Rhexocercosporidium sp. MPI-PUGE-AT-0058]|nr:hypothetical protein BKA65DRAFT_3791 [Rhexocercosporidium sp. MPI-PUGE-AT-0058]